MEDCEVCSNPEDDFVLGDPNCDEDVRWCFYCWAVNSGHFEASPDHFCRR